MQLEMLCDINSCDLPKHAVKAEVYICCDSRKEECKYSRLIQIEEEDISFKQYFCTYLYRRNA